ncbi:MAG: 4Fe-4S dicluster domain-containing protein [Methanobacterium sp.]|uniref:4Fe-4S dicluster domain-containing protein n=1 Tax=Methanobacterium sp. TaxID=2164 RepID=UPI003C72BDC3
MPNNNISSTENPHRTIKRVELNEELDPYDDILFKKSGFKKCIQCGRCTASCPAAYLYQDYNPRKLMRRFMFLDIYSREINEIIWKCGQCYSCRARCPRNCKAGLGVQSLQIRSVKVGEAPKDRLDIAKQIKINLYKYGEVFIPSMFKGFILNEFGDKGHTWFLKAMAKRKSLGFESESSRLSKIPVDALEEVRKILELTGFMEEIEK